MKPCLALIAVVVLLGSAASFAAETAQVPKEVAKVLNFYVGEWTLEGKIGDTPFKGKASFRMPPGKHCIVGTVSSRIGGEPMHFSLVSGWDSSTGWYTEQGSGSDGTVYSIKWKRVSPTVDEGKQVGSLDGKAMPETDRLERKGDDDFVVKCTERKKGDETLPDMTFSFHRVPRDKAKGKAPK